MTRRGWNRISYPFLSVITPSVAPFHCDNVDEFLFWDGTHPTAAAHAIIAQRAAATLAR